MGAEGDRVAPRFERGCRCFGVMQDGTLVAYGWWSAQREWIGELGLEISPAEGEVYIWNCFTLAPHRRRGFYRALLEGIVARAREERVLRLWIGSVADPAEKADADAGFVPVLHLASAGLGPLRWLRARPAGGRGGELASQARERLGLNGWTEFGRFRARKH